MFNFLTDTEQRQLDFVTEMYKTKDWMRLAAYAQKLNCSERALRMDLHWINDHFKEFHIETSIHGIRLNFTQGKNLDLFYQYLLQHSTHYQILEYIFLYEGLSLAQLSDKFSISSSTLYRYIKEINTKLIRHDFQIESSSLSLEGNEEKIRLYYYLYFDERYRYTNWQGKVMDTQALNDLLRFFITFTHFQVDFAFYHVFKLVSSINLVRYRRHHKVDTSDASINFDEIIPDLTDHQDVFSSIEDKLGIAVSNEMIHQVFTPYVQDGFSLSYDRLVLKAKKNPQLAESIHYLDTFFTDLAERHDVSLTNKEELIFSLHNASHLEDQEPQAGHILYDQNQIFVDQISEVHPIFSEDLLQGMRDYRHFLGKADSQEGSNYFFYSAFVFWHNLVPELHSQLKKVRLAVISSLHRSHANMYKDFIEKHFTEQVTVEVFSALKFSQQSLEQMDCDVLVTNFYIPSSNDKEIVYMENTPSSQDKIKLEGVITKLLSQLKKQNS